MAKVPPFVHNQKMFIILALITAFSAVPLPDCKNIRSREPVSELIVPPITEVNKYPTPIQAATTTMEPLRRQLRWENELRFERSLESGLKWIARVLDPFNLLLQFNDFQFELRRLNVIAIFHCF